MVAEVIGTLGLTAAVDLPMKPLALNNPAYWCERAADARRMAEHSRRHRADDSRHRSFLRHLGRTYRSACRTLGLETDPVVARHVGIPDAGPLLGGGFKL